MTAKFFYKCLLILVLLTGLLHTSWSMPAALALEIPAFSAARLSENHGDQSELSQHPQLHTPDAPLQVETAILHASDGEGLDLFGKSVAFSGDTIVVGAPYESGGTGAVYVFQKTPGTESWQEVAILHASDAQIFDQFGLSVAIDGDTIVVGAPYEAGGSGDPAELCGAVYIFQNGVDGWAETQILHASDLETNDQFGWSVGIFGDTIIVGAPNEDGGPGSPRIDSGAGYVFQYALGGIQSWSEAQILRASDSQANDLFGYSVAIDGQTIVAGAYGEDGGAGNPKLNSGAAYVFQYAARDITAWSQVQILRASDGEASDVFSYGGVGVAGNLIVVSASGEDGGPGNPMLNAGAAYIFEFAAGVWSQIQILHASDAQAGDNFGSSVAVSGEVIVSGARNEDGGSGDPISNSGAAYVFEPATGGGWQETGLLHASDAQIDDRFGTSLNLASDQIVIGAPEEDGGTGDPAGNSGAAYVFQLTAPNTPPMLAPIGNQVGSELALITFTAVATDTDLPPNTLTFSLDAGAPAGAAIDSSSGVFTWTPSEAQAPGVFPVTVRVTDDGVPPLDDFETIQITVNEVNQAPMLAPIGDKAGDENTLITFTASATDGDLPANTLAFSLDAGAPSGAAIDASSGVFTWTPDEAQGPGTYNVTLRVTDNGEPAMDDFESIQITVNEINQAPVLAVVGNQAGNEGTLITFTATATDDDLPTNELTYSLDAGAPEGAAINPSTGVFMWTPDEIQGPGIYAITVRVTDDGNPALDDFESIEVTVNEVNQPPVAIEDAYTTEEDIVLVVTAPGVLANDSDPDLPANPLSALLDSSPMFGELILGDDGAIIYTPTLDFTGTVTFTYHVYDGQTSSEITLVSIEIAPENDDPIVEAGEDQTAGEGQQVQFTGSFSDPGLRRRPALHNIAWDFGDGVKASDTLTPTHAYADDGVYTVTLVVTDELGGVGMDWLLVTVSNFAPELEALPDLSVTAGELLTIVGSFSDPGLQDSYSLFIDWGDGMTETQVLPAGVYDFSAGHVYAMAGSYTVSISVTDDDGGLDSQTFSVTVMSPTSRTFLPFLTKE